MGVIAPLLFVGALALGLAALFPDALAAEDARLGLVQALGLIVLLGGGIVAAFRSKPGTAFSHAVAWIAILIGLVAVYAYRDDFRAVGLRVAGALLPSAALTTGAGEVTLRAGQNGHFLAAATVNGAPLRLLVDTGASAVVLTPEAARRVGIEPTSLAYDRPISTANGTAVAAAVLLDTVAVGDLVQRDVPALVTQPGALQGSLLGLSFLRRLDEFRFTGDRLILRG